VGSDAKTPVAEDSFGATENAGLENAGPLKMQGWKMQDWKTEDQFCRGGKRGTGKHGNIICMDSQT